jgi:hypothetical protein
MASLRYCPFGQCAIAAVMASSPSVCTVIATCGDWVTSDEKP